MPNNTNAQIQQNQNPINALGPATLQTLKSVGATPEGAISDSQRAIVAAIMKGVTTGLQKSSQEAVMQAGPQAAQHIMSTYVDPQMSPSGQSTDQSSQTVGGQSNQPSLNDMQKQALGNILQGTIRLTKQPQGVIAGFLQGFAQGTGYTKGALDNLNSAASTVGSVQEQVSGTPYQQGTLDIQKAAQDRNIYASSVAATSDALKSIDAQYSNLSKQFQNLNETKGIVNKTFNNPSPEQLNTLEQMKALSAQRIEHLNRLRDLMLNAPKNLSGKSNSQDTSNNQDSGFKILRVRGK